ncbi:hypothetical protein V8E53_009181 [Lactarius tabidus]
MCEVIVIVLASCVQLCWLASISLILPELEHSQPSYTACRGFRVSTGPSVKTEDTRNGHPLRDLNSYMTGHVILSVLTEILQDIIVWLAKPVHTRRMHTVSFTGIPARTRGVKKEPKKSQIGPEMKEI